LSRSRMIAIAAMLGALSGASMATAQTVASLKTISGDGQVVCLCISSSLQFFQPITVQALDANGNGVANATITWTVTSGQATVGSPTTVTDSNGRSSNPLNQTVLAIYGTLVQPFLQTTIVAAANSGNPSATFYETYALIDQNGNPMVRPSVPTQNGQQFTPTGFSGNSGSTVPDIQVFAGGEGLAADGVPNVSVQLVPPPGQTSPTITCAPSSTSSLFGNSGAVLSGSNGYATCSPVLGGSGTGQFYVMVGGVPTNWVAGSTGGTVNTNGTAVTWESGVNFGSLASGQQIQINGLEYSISTVTSTTALVLGSSAGVQNGVLWTPYVPLFLEEFGPYTFTSTPGTPSAITLVQGNNQAVVTAQSLGTLIAQVVDSRGNAVQGVNVNWSANPVGAVSLSFTPNFSTSDNNGQVSTVANFSGAAAGAVDITVSLAGNSAINATFVETAIVPITKLVAVSGGGQSAVAGTAFAAPLIVQVFGISAPVTNYPVQFSVSGPAILSASTAVTNNSGQAQITVTAGSATGTATVTASVGGLSQTFILTVTPTGPTPNGITIVSGNLQSTIINTNFPASLVVQVNSSAGAVGNYTVTFSSSGSVALSSSSGLTNSAGQTSVTVTAGSVAGAATVTASIPGYSVTFSLTVSPPGPAINAASFANAASGQSGFISPCGIATITAAGLDPNGAASLFPAPVFGPLPTSTNGISVDFNNYFAPIFSATLVNGQPQLMVQVPCEVTPSSSVPVTVNVGAGSTPVNVKVLAAAPGIFQIPYSDGGLRAVALRSDGSFVSLSNPARLSEIVRIYVTGLGPTFPSVGTGQVDNPGADLIGADAQATGTVIVGVSGGGAQVTSARLAANLIGVFEVAFIVPSNAPLGNNTAISVSVIPAGTPSTNQINSLNTTLPIGQ